MKKITVVCIMMVNISCSSLMNPQAQPVHVTDAKNNIYTTTCSGMAETLGSCYQKAQKTCNKGFRLIEEKLDSSGVHRAITFQCK